MFFVPDCVDDCVWSLGSGKQENWALVINRIRRTGLMQFRTGLMQDFLWRLGTCGAVWSYVELGRGAE